MKLGVQVGLGPGHIMLDGDPAPFRKRGWSPLPNFRPISIVDKTAGCIKMPLGMEVGLSPENFVLDKDPGPPKFSAHMFIIVIVISLEHCTMHSRYMVCSSSSSTTLYILFLEKKV